MQQILQKPIQNFFVLYSKHHHPRINQEHHRRFIDNKKIIWIIITIFKNWFQSTKRRNVIWICREEFTKSPLNIADNSLTLNIIKTWQGKTHERPIKALSYQEIDLRLTIKAKANHIKKDHGRIVQKRNHQQVNRRRL